MRVKSLLARILVLLAAVQILGGHWAVLQSVAWVKMVADYSEKETFAAAVEKTLNGQNPCTLCKIVSEGRATEEKSPTAKEVQKVKFEAVISPQVESLLPTGVPCRFFVAVDSTRDGFSSVPVPPPRRA